MSAPIRAPAARSVFMGILIKVGAGEPTALQGGRAGNALFAVADGDTALIRYALLRGAHDGNGA